MNTDKTSLENESQPSWLGAVMRMCGGYLVETKKWKAVKSGRIMQTFRAKYSMNPSFI